MLYSNNPVWNKFVYTTINEKALFVPFTIMRLTHRMVEIQLQWLNHLAQTHPQRVQMFRIKRTDGSCKPGT